MCISSGEGGLTVYLTQHDHRVASLLPLVGPWLPQDKPASLSSYEITSNNKPHHRLLWEEQTPVLSLICLTQSQMVRVGPTTLPLAGQFPIHSVLVSSRQGSWWPREPPGQQPHGDKTLTCIYEITVHATSAEAVVG